MREAFIMEIEELQKKPRRNGVLRRERAGPTDGAMLRHPVRNPKRKVLLSTAANFPQLRNQGLIELVGESQTSEGDAC
jgi:hypothetical protein